MTQKTELPPTALISGRRAKKDVLAHYATRFSELEVLNAVLDAVPNPVMILNVYRQIVYANQAMAGLVGVGNAEELIGMRPGEALNCIHANESEDGCGSTAYCMFCGAARAIFEAQGGQAAVEECRVARVLTETPAALDLRVWTRPYTFEEETFTIFVATDISDQKRRQALERIFFHDILNSVQKMRSALDLLQDADASQRTQLMGIVNRSLESMVQEIQTQRDLVAMENDELRLRPSVISARELTRDILESYAHAAKRDGRELRVSPRSEEVVFVADRTQLQRVLDNMVKNALEAERGPSTVTIGYRRRYSDTRDRADGNGDADKGQVEFWVHNPTPIPEPVQHQIFQRSFSTKGAGRGLGTYSMKMLTERYLEGEIEFASEPEAGTTFRVRYPIKPTYAKDQPSRSRPVG
ncbi:MAG: PAS domain-containing sensor histidine kinase [Anaerolineae bacterium]